MKKEHDGKITYSFHGLSFRQNPNSPELFSFVASSNDLAKFCGVARKSEGFLANYQRAIDLRRVRDEVTPFFKDPANCSPTAIVLSLHATPISEVKFEDIESQELDPGVNIRTLSITIRDPDTVSRDEIIENAKQFLDARIACDETEDESDEEEFSEESEESDEEAKDSEDEVDEDNGSDVEIGQSMLRNMRKVLDNEDQITDEIIDTLKEMLLPALVIDGQHRLFGAAAVEEDVPLLVCSLISPDWKEQVFQFTVINDKSVGIPKPFITSLAGMSLTSLELDSLRDRLRQAGVQLWEVEVMQRLGYDSHSPFCNRIEFKVSGKGTFGLGYQTMKRIGRAWYDPKKNPGMLKLMKTLYHGDPAAKATMKSLIVRWQGSGDWFRYFVSFWGAFEDKFGGTPLWENKSQFMTAVVLEQLQKAFFVYLDFSADYVFPNINEEDLTKRSQLLDRQFRNMIVDKFADKFKDKHFEKEWKVKSLSHKDGKELLTDYFDKIQKNAVLTNHALLTGSH